VADAMIEAEFCNGHDNSQVRVLPVRKVQACGSPGRRAAGGPLLVSYCEPPWLDDGRYCPNGLLGYLDAAGQRPGDEPLARELRRQQTFFRDLLGAMEGEGRAPRLAKAYHADEHAALNREP